MKKKRMTTAALAAMMALTAVGGMTVYGASDTKTATLNNAQVRFNNGKVQTIQCYNIDGYNYVRARDITNNLDMKVAAYQNGQSGIVITSDKKSTSTADAEKLTQKTAKVNVVTGEISYDGIPYQTECFLLNGRYYFKLADFAKASDESLTAVLEMNEIWAKGDIATGPSAEIFPSIEVVWDADTRVISVDRVETDLQAYFDEIRGTGSSAKADREETSVKEETKKEETTTKTEGTVKGTGVLTSAPKVGTILANVLIDEDEGAYLDNGRVNWDNIEKPYTYYSEKNFGQCTWYAKGRFIETHGIDVTRNPFTNATTYMGWVTNAKSDKCPDLDGTTDPNEIEAGCIAMFDGHALFVEYVEYDSKGNPETVYFTEANTQHNGTYYPDKDGKVQAMNIDKFITRQSFVGYIIVK